MGKRVRPRVRDHVVFHDSRGVAHNALVKAAWDVMECETDEKGEYVSDGDGNYKNHPKYADDDPTDLPCINLVYVSDDDNRGDSCGRQTIVEGSVVHKSSQHVHGQYWRWPHEEENPYRAPSDV